jgi:hypothetical protein
MACAAAARVSETAGSTAAGRYRQQKICLKSGDRPFQY